MAHCSADVAAAFRDIRRLGISLRTVDDHQRVPGYDIGTFHRHRALIVGDISHLEIAYLIWLKHRTEGIAR